MSTQAIDRANLDTATSPGDCFYQYANGGWMKNNPIPDGYSKWNNFAALNLSNQVGAITFAAVKHCFCLAVAISTHLLLLPYIAPYITKRNFAVCCRTHFLIFPLLF
jgi:hypothetical protein